jgi:hypothetical protein
MDSWTETSAEMSLSQLLDKIKLLGWHDVVVDWANRYDGWRALYEASPTKSPDFGPLAMVIKELVSFPSADEGSDVAIADLLSKCDFVYWRAASAMHPGDAWNPLFESFGAFHARCGNVNVWMDTEALIQPEAIKYWLLGRHAHRDWNLSTKVGQASRSLN